MTLTRSDIHRLTREPSPEVRADIAAKVADGFNRSYFSGSEQQLATDIFRLLVRDTALMVRQAVAEQLKRNPSVPHDIIMTLASDTADISVAVLEHSLVLSDEDLVELVHTTGELRKWLAISRRKALSPRICHTLIETENAKVATSLLKNNGAEMEEEDLQQVIETFPREQSVLGALVQRNGISATFAEKLYDQVSDALKKQLTKRHRLSWSLVSEAVEVGRESAILSFIAPWMTRQDIEKLVDQMHRNKRLNYSIVIHALCSGEMDFFEVSLARMTGLPPANVKILLADKGPLGFRAVYDLAGFPEGFAEAVKIIYTLAVEDTSHGASRTSCFQAWMIDRIVANGYHERIENIPYFIALMRQQRHGRHTVH